MAKIVKIVTSSYTTLAVFRPRLFGFDLWDIGVDTNFVENFIGYPAIKSFSSNFQLHGLLWPKSSKSTTSSYTTLAVFAQGSLGSMCRIDVDANFVENFMGYPAM